MTWMVRNCQKSILLNLHYVRKDFQLLNQITGLQEFDATLSFVTKKKLAQHQKHNKEFRHKEMVTLPEALISINKKDADLSTVEKNLGWILVCPKTLLDKHSVRERDAREVVMPIMVRGLLELCGYKDKNDIQRSIFIQKEIEILHEVFTRTGVVYTPYSII
jgi:ssRNA-specific RNase YbeY (16S rRNA maturation enzyme)